MLLICLLSGAPRGQSRRRLFLKKGRMMRTSTMIVHNHVLNKPTMSRRLQWLRREHNYYSIRWIHSLLIMSIQLLRMIYYLIEVKCLYSGLKNTTWMDRPLSVQSKQVEDDVLLSRFWLPNSWWILYQSQWFQPKCYIWMERWWSLLSYATDGTSFGAL